MRARRLALAAFPLALWVLVLAHFGGEVGKQTDDWALSRADPATGQAPADVDRYLPGNFWRPLHNLMLMTVGTFAFDRVQPVGIFCAAMHAVCCIQLYRLLRVVSRTSQAPACGAVLFMLAPVHHEVVYWFSSVSSAIACGLILTLMRRVVSASSRGNETLGAAAPTRGAWQLYAVVFSLAFLSACFYEQAMALVAGLPMLCAAMPRDTRGRWGLMPTVARSLGVAVVAGVLYIAFFIATTPAQARGGVRTLVGPEGLGDRLGTLLVSLQHVTLGAKGSQIVRGSFELGLEVLGNAQGLAMMSLLAGLGIVFVGQGAYVELIKPRRNEGSGDAAAPAEKTEPRRLAWLIVGGAAMSAGSLAPLAVVQDQPVEMRNLYAFLIGPAVIVGALMDALGHAAFSTDRTMRARWKKRTSGMMWAMLSVAVVAAVLAGGVCHVGQQELLRRVWRADSSGMVQIRELIPEPMEQAVFVPMRDDYQPASTGEISFDRMRPSALDVRWGGEAMLQQTYRRGDLALIASPWWASSSIQDAGSRGVMCRQGVVKSRAETEKQEPTSERAAMLRKSRWVAWERMVPFVRDRQGRIRLIELVTVELPSGERVVQRFEWVKEIGRRFPGSTIRRHYVVASMDAAVGSWASGWRSSTGEELDFRLANIHQLAQPTTWLNAQSSRSAMATTIPSDAVERSLTLRATIRAEDLEKIAKADDSRITRVVISNSATGQELGKIELSPRQVRKQRRWWSARIELPAGRAAPIRVEVQTPASKNEPAGAAPTVTISPGLISPGLIGPVDRGPGETPE